jgi:hypothetical protein
MYILNPVWATCVSLPAKQATPFQILLSFPSSIASRGGVFWVTIAASEEVLRATRHHSHTGISPF